MICKLQKHQNGYILVVDEPLATYQGINGFVAQSTELNMDGLPYFELTNGYTLRDHKEGDGIIRIYNGEGHIHVMYPYHLIKEAHEHLDLLNRIPISKTLTEEQLKLLWFGKKYTCEEDCHCHTECPKADEYIFDLNNPLKRIESIEIRSTWACTNYNGEHRNRDCNCKTGLIVEPITHQINNRLFVKIEHVNYL